MSDSSHLISISEKAMQHIAQIRRARQEGEGVGFRLGVKLSGCSGWLYQPNIVDEIAAEDIQCDIDGLTVLLPSEHMHLIKGTHIDIQDKGLGQQVLVYQNPNASGECGCGESFSVPNDEEDKSDE